MGDNTKKCDTCGGSGIDNCASIDQSDVPSWCQSCGGSGVNSPENRNGLSADAFRNAFAILHNIDRSELEDAGIILRRNDTAWTRFNNNLTTFVLKLDDDKLDALYALVQARQPERYRKGVA